MFVDCVAIGAGGRPAVVVGVERRVEAPGTVVECGGVRVRGVDRSVEGARFPSVYLDVEL